MSLSRALALLLAPALVAAVCEDLTLESGEAWHDKGGDKYNCATWYSKPGKCDKDGEKYPFEGMSANDACCICGGGTEPGSEGSSCVPTEGWVHPQFKDDCAAYMPGGASHRYECDAQAKANCCTCQPKVAEEKSTCTDIQVDGMPWHDDGGEDYDCDYYASKLSRCVKDGDKYAWGGHTAQTACCKCGGGDKVEEEPCEDILLGNGDPWHDDGGDSYTCSYYGARASRCEKNGHKYEFEGKTANQACCVCGGGKDPDEDFVVKGTPKPDEGDDIVEEWCGGTLFRNKKHLQGDMILYWNVDLDNEKVTFGLLGPSGSATANRWIAMGVSPSGFMAGSDSVAAWVDDDNEIHMEDLHFENQSPSGVKRTPRQQIYDATVQKHDDRLAYVYSRPWSVGLTGGVALKPLSEFAPIIYAHGKVNSICALSTVICNHKADERWTTEVALTAPEGMAVYDLNKGGFDEPCHGPAQLECAMAFTCYHEFAGDQFANDLFMYGQCKADDFFNPEDDMEDVEDWSGVQTVFPNANGGYDKEVSLRGGFVLLYTMNKESPPGQFGPNDYVSCALISTFPTRQGWIGLGWSPNGEMKGTDVVIGWSEGDNEFIGDYYLAGQVSSLNTPANKQGIINERVIRKNGQIAIQFDRPLTPADSVQFVEGDMHVILATGPTPDQDDTEYIPYHRYRSAQDVTFIELPLDSPLRNTASENELCMGPANIKCKQGLDCLPFPEEMFDINWEDVVGDTEGFTPNTDFGNLGKGENPFSDMDKLRDHGMCLKEGVVANFQDVDPNQIGMGGNHLLDPAHFDHMYRLRWGFELHWKFLDDGMIRIGCQANLGPGYLGVGFGGGGAMIGATSVLGWASFDDTEQPSTIDEYYHADKLPWEVRPISQRPEHASYSLGVTNLNVVHNGPETAIVFERPLLTPTGHGDITPGPIPVIVAVGNVPSLNDDYFGYHRFRTSKFVTFMEPTSPTPPPTPRP